MPKENSSNTLPGNATEYLRSALPRLERIFNSHDGLAPFTQSPSHASHGSDASVIVLRGEDNREIPFHWHRYLRGRESRRYSRCHNINNRAVLHSSDFILTVYGECEHGSFIDAFKYDDEDWKIHWSWEGSRQECDNHFIRNNAIWLFHIYTNNSPGIQVGTTALHHGFRSHGSFDFDIHLDNSNNIACELFGDVLYFINRKIWTDDETGQKLVDYNGFIVGHSAEADEDDYYKRFNKPLEFKRAFPVYGQVRFAELSLRKDPDTAFPMIIDSIRQEHAGETNQQSWVFFSQLIEYPLSGEAVSAFNDPLSLHDLPTPGVIIYSGPEKLESPQIWALESPPRPSGGDYSLEDSQ